MRSLGTACRPKVLGRIPRTTSDGQRNPWEDGYVESFNGKLRDELLNGELFYTLHEAQVLVERWRQRYNAYRPHSALGYRPPAPRRAPSHISCLSA